MVRINLQLLILLIILSFLVPMRSTIEWHPSGVITLHSTQNPMLSVSSSTISFDQLHTPIKIMNNSDFATQAAEENWSGDGSLKHPYVIEGLQIAGSFNLIKISNTSVYFQISGCSLTLGRVGISLYHVSNGLIFNNSIFECFEMGVYFQSSGNCTIANNTIASNGLGLSMSSCFNISIQNNSISANGQEGIYSTDLTNCTIFFNHISHNEWGIRIGFFLGLKILDNLVENNHNGGILVERNEIFSRYWKGHEYRLISGDKTWVEAKLDCETRGGHLVTITSQAENTLVSELVDWGAVWIGLTDEITEDEWRWVTGEAVNYTQWGEGEPNDAGDGEDYAELYGSGQWNDLSADHYNYYVCEWETIVIPILISHSVISGNQVINNSWDGITAEEVQNIRISDNIIINKYHHCLELSQSSFCNITQNQVIGGGIRFYCSGNNRIANNSVTGYGFTISGWEPSDYEQIFVVNNSVNGKAFVYRKYISDELLPEAGQVFLLNCQNISILSQNISFTSTGVVGIDCVNVTVANNIFNNNSEYAIWFRGVDCMISNNEMWHNRQGLGIEDSRNFTIFNNTIEESYWEGILLDDSEQTVLMKNTIRYNGEEGIRLYRSHNSHISNNTVSNNRGDGIRLYYSNMCILTNNTITNNMEAGINVFSSHYNSLTNNSVINNHDQGIMIDWSAGNFINNNYLINNSFSLAGGDYEHYTQAEIVNNTINNKPIVYWLHQTGKVPSGAGLVILVDSNAVTVENQSLVGIFGVFCTYLSINNNLISNGRYGIYLRDSAVSSISNNTIMNTRGTGIELRDTPNNLLVNNTITQNEDGMNLDYSRRSTLVNNTVINNGGTGIHLWGSGSSSVINNTVIKNGGTGIRLDDSSNTILNRNYVINNSGGGIHIDWSWDNSIVNNFLINNSFSISGEEYGHYIQTEFENNVLNNKPIIYWLHKTAETVPNDAAYVLLVDCTLVTVVNQNLYGIVGMNCTNLMIRNNIIANGSQGIQVGMSLGCYISDNIVTNTSEGIELWDSEQSILMNNTVKDCKGAGFVLQNSGGSSLINNTIAENGGGIHLDDSPNTILTNNTVSGNSGGSWIWDSQECILTNNQITNNEGTGIDFLYSEYCTLSGNFIAQNGGDGVFLDESHFTSVTQNWIENNKGSGLVIGEIGWWYYGSSSDNCDVVNNIITRNRGNGVIIQISNYCVLMNNSIESNNETGILLESSHYCTLFCNNIIDNNVAGIQIVEASSNNLVSGNTISKHKYYGITIPLGENNTVSYNNFYGNNLGKGSQADDNGWANVFTHNFWDNWTNPDANEDNIVDVAYSIAGSANNLDLSPSTKRNHLILGCLLSPRYGETLSGVVTIQWIAVDLLGHNITYSIFYSTGGGEEWILLESGLSVPYYNWDTETIDDGAQYFLRIIANCSEGESCIFSSNFPFIIDNGRHISPFSIISPRTGDLIAGTIEIRWTAGEDVFGHDVFYTVSLSPNNGQTWITLESNITSLSCVWDSTTSSDGSQYIIKVIAFCFEGSSYEASIAPLTVRNWPQQTTTSPPTFSPHTQNQDPFDSFPHLSTFLQVLGGISILFFIIILLIMVRRQQVK